MKTAQQLLPITFVLALSACGTRQPPDPGLRGRELFLCCTLHFNQDDDASDANYAYPSGGSMLRAGTRVHVMKTGSTSITFSPAGESRRYSIDMRFGNERQSPAEYFHKLLRDTDPRPGLADAPAEIQRAVAEGHLLKGMTKEQAIMARGYPPLHRTPDLNGDEWLYFQDRGLADRVRFANGQIVSIETVWAGR